MSKVLGYLFAIVAAIVILVAAWVFLSIPYGNESDDFVAPLVGGVILVLSSIALVLNAQVALRLTWFPRSSHLFVHLANVGAVLLLVMGIAPWLLTRPFLLLHDWALLSLPVFVLISYIYSIKVIRRK